MTRLAPLLERNALFAAQHTPGPLARPTSGTLIVTCLDHRVDPALILGLHLAEAPVIRNAGGRITDAVIDDIAFLAFLAGQLFVDRTGGPGSLFEVAVIHHTQCGSGLLADPDFRAQASQATGVPQDILAANAVIDPEATVALDVQRLLDSPRCSPEIIVSGHVYDVETGRVTTVLDAASSVASSQ
jgi:carbonic anhydrase